MAARRRSPPPKRSPRRPKAAGAKPTPERLAQMAWGYAAPLVVEAAIRLGLFEALAAGPRALADLAAAAKASPRGVRAVADALVGLGLLARRGERYALTAESAAFLVRGSPAYHGAFFAHISDQVLPNWLRLEEAARSGRPVVSVNAEAQGTPFFAEFVESLFPLSVAAGHALAAELRLAASRRPVSVLDLAAGSGVWGIALAQASPQVRVTAVDWPGVLPVTRRVAAREGVGDRFTYVAGDLATADLGEGHDVATLGHIVHSEGEERSRALLRRVAKALRRGGTVAVAEFLVDDDRRGPQVPLFFAVNMLLHTERGDAFTYRDLAGWLRDAGFRAVRKLPAPGPSPLVVATRA